MSGHAIMLSRDEAATSMTSSEALKSRWMSRWINDDSKSGPAIDNSSLLCYEGEHLDSKGYLMQTGLKMEDSLPHGKGIRKFPFPMLSLGKNKEKASAVESLGDHVLDHNPTSLALAVRKGDHSRDLNMRGNDQQVMSRLCQKAKGMVTPRPSTTYNKPDASKPVVVFERHFSNDNFTCFSQEGCKYQKSSSVLLHEKKMQNNLSHMSGLNDGVQHVSPKKKNFESLFLKKQSRKVPCSFQNVETMRICTMVDSVENKPGDPPKISQRAHHILFTKETCVNLSKGHQVMGEPSLAHHDENALDGSINMFPSFASCPRGVKIQPLWTSTDSEEKETTGNPSICKASSRNEESAETDGIQVELSLAQPKEKQLGGSFRKYSDVASHSRGLKIQPLLSFTDGEQKKFIGNPFTCKAGSRNEASAETDGMQLEAPKNLQLSLGMESSSFTKYDTMADNSPLNTCDSSTEKARSKRPIDEIPDINEELPCLQPAVSSNVEKEPSTSRVHSLNAKQLFSCNEQTSRTKCKVSHPVDQDAGSRWIKRLKMNSSDSFGVGTKSSDAEEDSTHDKFSIFFNRMMKGNRESCDVKLQKHHEKEQMVTNQNVESQKSVGPSSACSKKRNRSMMHGCAWIHRWCQQCTTSPPTNPEPLVICEPHSLKNGQEEIAKKQFPSIAAMALMGKAMHGFPSCEFKKKGSVVVWNTKEY